MINLNCLYYRFFDYCQRRHWRKSLKKSTIHGEVMMYHHITDDYVETIPSCRCTIRVFEHYLDVYEKMGVRFVSINDAYSIICEGKDNNPFCLVTFDDVSDTVYQNAFPILRQRNIPFTVFVATQFVDWVNPSTGEQFITMEHLLELDKDPLCTVGAHTSSHPMLRHISDPKREMQENKKWLEDHLGHPIDFLAYPYGKRSSVSHRIQVLAKEIGFKCAFSTIEAPLTDVSSSNLFFLPRIPKY